MLSDRKLLNLLQSRKDNCHRRAEVLKELQDRIDEVKQDRAAVDHGAAGIHREVRNRRSSNISSDKAVKMDKKKVRSALMRRDYQISLASTALRLVQQELDIEQADKELAHCRDTLSAVQADRLVLDSLTLDLTSCLEDARCLNIQRQKELERLDAEIAVLEATSTTPLV